MPVIINEFDVIPEPTPPAAASSDSGQQAPPPRDTLPQQVDSVLRLQQQRAARVRAE